MTFKITMIVLIIVYLFGNFSHLIRNLIHFLHQSLSRFRINSFICGHLNAELPNLTPQELKIEQTLLLLQTQCVLKIWSNLLDNLIKVSRITTTPLIWLRPALACISCSGALKSLNFCSNYIFSVSEKAKSVEEHLIFVD